MSISEPGKIITPWAESGLRNEIPQEASFVTGRAGFDQGFSAINMTPKEEGGIPPFGQDFNGIFYDITSALRYMQAGGRSTFSAEMAAAIGGYPKGAVLIGDDGISAFQNTVDGNTTNPNLGGSGWARPDNILRESLRRSYAEAGFNLVDGSFQFGFTLVNENDVALDEVTGKAFSGPSGTYPASTDQTSGGFIDQSDNIAVHMSSYAAIRAYVGGALVIETSCRIHVFDRAYGTFDRDVSDTATADDDCTVLIDAIGRRWKRRIDADVLPEWAGADFSGGSDATGAVLTAILSAKRLGRNVRLDGEYLISTVNGVSSTSFAAFVLSGLSNMRIHGKGTLKFPSDTVRTQRSFFFVTDSENVSIGNGITFDGSLGSRSLPTGYAPYDNALYFAQGCKNCRAENGKYKNIIGFSVLYYTSNLNVTQKIKDAKITGNYASGCRQTPYCIIDSIGYQISGNVAEEGFVGAPSVNYGVQLESAQNQGFEFAPIGGQVFANTVRGYKSGIYAWNSIKGAKIFGNDISGCSGDGIIVREDIRDVSVFANDIRNCGGGGIQYGSFSNISGYDQWLSIYDNTITDCASHGIYSDERSDLSKIFDNDIRRCGGSGVSMPVNSSNEDVFGNTIVDCGLNAASPTPAIFVRGDRAKVHRNKCVKTTSDSKQYLVQFNGTETEFTGNSTVGDHVNQSTGKIYGVFGDNNAYIPTTIDNPDIDDDLLGRNLLVGRFISKGGVFTNHSGGTFTGITAENMDRNRRYTFVRTHSTAEFWLEGSFKSYSGTSYVRIKLISAGAFVILVNVNGVIYIDAESGTVNKE